MDGIFGLDFGTTNSVASLIQRDTRRAGGGYRAISLLNQDDQKPHPSVVWYSAGGPVIGRKARDQMSEPGIGVFGDVVRSPKMFLGSPSPISVGGTTRAAADVVAEILSFLRQDAVARGFPGEDFKRAVVTIPVALQGPGRRELREAANKAGIRIHQFVHEPLAALYGYLRNGPNFAEEVSRLEGRLVLVFDWGGGTLDLTLCKFMKGALVQVLNLGDPEVGGDQFDLRLRGLVRERHQQMHPTADWSRLQPTAEARLLKACEDAKIALSEREKTTIFVRQVLATEGPARDLEVEITRADLRRSVEDLVRRGLSAISRIVEAAGIPTGAVEFCLATGGMVAMPAIREGLVEVLGVSRLRTVPNSATIISEGAAWIAHDDIRLSLAKPLEILHADESYVPLIPAQAVLPTEGEQIQHSMSFYCADPRDGKAKFQFARPRWPGRDSSADGRAPYVHVTIPVDPFAKPLFERLDVCVTIDHDMIAGVRAQSSLSNHEQKMEIWDLEFGLSLSAPSLTSGPVDGGRTDRASSQPDVGPRHRAHTTGSVRVRSNLATSAHAWNQVPGEIVLKANPHLLEQQLTRQQHDEKMYYARCYDCGRTIYEIERDGCDKCSPRGHALSTREATKRWRQLQSVFATVT